LLVLPLLFVAGLACSNLAKNSSSGNSSNSARSTAESKPSGADTPAKLDSYTIKGMKFAYFKIPSGLSEEKLIEIAQKLHDQTSDAQLILVDEDSELADYIKYAKAISGVGEIEKPMPMEWADKHIVANVQKYTSGKFVLCKGYGSVEIADLK